MPAVMEEPPQVQQVPKREPRTTSVFEFTCLCGKLIQTPEKETVCPKCGRVIELHWGLR